ncbi:MAG: aminoacyl-tRNA hydrolase [Chitinivibrionales bacterium]|nr:aminoacyl-tRNA hydrolase [Chitinivibrionales bacterium]MBD3397146.1 aminoacyl-tRNA hydrolase [Chitinivibrionales bacterium]
MAMSWLSGAFRSLVRAMRSRPSEDRTADAIVFGMGNIGAEYANTRHNIGFLVVDRFVREIDVVGRRRMCRADVTVGRTQGGRRVACAKPVTFVNRSGRSVRELTGFFNRAPSECLVVVDDFHLASGRLRFRRQGSDGGHNGLKSVVEAVGTGFPRLRVGIGPLPEGTSTVDFVLGEFTVEEEERTRETVDRAAEAVGVFLDRGMEAAMSTYNA